MKNTVTLEKLHDILGERIRLLSDTTVPAEVRREELELTQTICTAAKQVVNNADVAPVRHGKWALNSDETHWECSECGSHAPDVIDEENGYQVVEWLSSYCPHCGADMRE